MPTLAPTDEQLAAFAAAPLEGPIVMVNLLRFRPDGARTYARYAKQVAPLLAAVGGRVLLQTNGQATVIGPDTWDRVLIVEYPSRDKFLEMIQTEDYRQAAKLRALALVDSRLYCTQAA